MGDLNVALMPSEEQHGTRDPGMPPGTSEVEIDFNRN